MESPKTPESPNQYFNMADFLQGEISLKNVENLQRLTLYTFKSMFLIKASKSVQIDKQLWIDRNSGRPIELPETEQIPSEFTLVRDYSALLGVITILEKQYLVMVDTVFPICSLDTHKIYTIGALSFIPLAHEHNFEPERKKQLLGYLVNIQKLLSLGYYFSFTYDLTLSMVKRMKNQPTDTQYQWNYSLCKEFIKFNVSAVWQIILIQGFIGHFSAQVADTKLNYCLISRRSSFNSGTRYYARGLGDDSSVANFVETEQIVSYQDRLFSHVQLRGSVPIFWKQKGIQTQVKIDRSYELTNHVYMNHMKYLNNNYGRIICVNLLSKGKKDEQMITEAFESHLRGNELHDVGYEYFDFHNAVKNQKYENVNFLINKIHPALDSFGFYMEDLSKQTVEFQQQGVIRTNCLDCLDRTNFIQSKIGMTVLDLELEKAGVLLRDIFGCEAFEELDKISSKTTDPFIIGFKNIWADNGDVLSTHYTGTGSVISNVTRIGKRNVLGMLDHSMKSINRFYNGNFEDKAKQDCLDFILGNHVTPINIFNEVFEREILMREKEFSTYSRVSVYMVTWNLGGYSPPPNLNVKNLFDFGKNPTPDVVVVGFQEYIELKATNILSKQQGRIVIPLWINLILKTLNLFDSYIIVAHRDLVGLLILVFAKKEISKRIVQVETDKVKTGMGGKLGNKGSVIVKLNIDDTSLCFINCHLEPSVKNLENRLEHLVDIHQKAFQKEELGKRRKERIMRLDYKFLFGDLNFRLTVGNESRTMIRNYQSLRDSGKDYQAEEVLKSILAFDQLLQNKPNDMILNQYNEARITFLPTYKYDLWSDDLDTSKKQRVPGWTDRIMWSCPWHGVEQLSYDRVDARLSDHRPVIAYFNVEIKLTDKIKKQQIVRQVYEVDDVVIKVEPDKLKIQEIKQEGGGETTSILETKVTELSLKFGNSEHESHSADPGAFSASNNYNQEND